MVPVSTFQNSFLCLSTFRSSCGHNMALDSARQLLNELMGRTRDLDPSERDSSNAEWNDERVSTISIH